jgi:hypothetical protein
VQHLFREIVMICLVAKLFGKLYTIL